MKYTLILLIFISNYVIGQIPNTATPRLIEYNRGIYKGPDSIQFYHRKKDTVLVFAMVIDTTHEFIEPYGCDSVSLDADSTEIIFWVKGEKQKPIDLGLPGELKTHVTMLYSVRELHNTGEGMIDPGMTPGVWKDYYQHIYYLDKDKQKLPSNIVVWMAK